MNYQNNMNKSKQNLNVTRKIIYQLFIVLLFMVVALLFKYTKNETGNLINKKIKQVFYMDYSKDAINISKNFEPKFNSFVQNITKNLNTNTNTTNSTNIDNKPDTNINTSKSNTKDITKQNNIKTSAPTKKNTKGQEIQ